MNPRRKTRLIARPVWSGPTENRNVARISCLRSNSINLGTPSRVPRNVSTSTLSARFMALFDDAIGAKQHGLRDRKSKRLRGLEIDHEFQLRELLDRKVAGLGTFENAIRVGSEAPERLRQIAAV